MILQIINSDSKGNCYLLKNDSATLLIECGVKFDEIKKANNFNVLNISACLISHEHADHSKAFKGVTGSGIPLISSNGTFKALGVPPELRTHTAAHGKTLKVKDWTIKSIDVNHDAAEPLGFILEHKETGPILFLTDLYLLDFDLSAFKFKTVIIEANYCELLAEDWRKSKGVKFVEKRRVTSHMSFQTTIKTLETFNLSECENIVLIHLSDGLTNAQQFKTITEQRFGITTTIADAGKTLFIGNGSPY